MTKNSRNSIIINELEINKTQTNTIGGIVTAEEFTQGCNDVIRGFVPTFYVTLNTDSFLRKNKLHRLEDLSIDLNRKVDVFVGWLSEELLGKKQKHLVRFEWFIEAGTDSGLLHCHMIVSLAVETQKTLREIQNFVERKWERFIVTDGQRAYWGLRKRPKFRTFWHMKTFIEANEGRLFWEPRSDHKVRKIRDAVNKALCDFKFEHEIDSLTNVKTISDAAKALGYSTKQLQLHMTNSQFCSANFQ